MRDLARRLLAVEAASQSATGAHVHEAVRVCDKLRISLTRFAGSDGFTSLLRRALALARAEVPSLQTVKVKPDCSLEGLGAARSRCDRTLDPRRQSRSPPICSGCWMTFIGKPLTLRLVREAWPDASLDE